MAKVASTREIIEKLEAYEKIHGIGAVTGIATICNGDRTVEYKLEIANDSDWNRVFNSDGLYKKTVIEISSVDDDELFERKTIDYIQFEVGDIVTIPRNDRIYIGQIINLETYLDTRMALVDVLGERKIWYNIDQLMHCDLRKLLVVLEPGGINHSESSRNNQSELIRNSQCTCLADRLPTVIQRDR